MKKSRTTFESGFQSFLPVPGIRNTGILFSDPSKYVYTHFLRRLVILKSNDLERISKLNCWNFTDINFMRLITGLYMKEFNLIEMSVNSATSHALNKIFHYMVVFLKEELKLRDRLQENFPFYRFMSNWTLKKFDEHIQKYRNNTFKTLEPLLFQIDKQLHAYEVITKTNILPTNEIAFFSRHQQTLKDLKLHIRKQDSTLIRDQRSKYDDLIYQTTVKKPIYSEKAALELFFKGKTSSMICNLKNKGYTLEEIQENIKHILLFYMSQNQLGIEYSTFLLQDIGLSAKLVFFGYFQETLRRDIRKRIKKHFKEIGVSKLFDDNTMAFLKLNELLSPVDNISVAVRRKWASESHFYLALNINSKSSFWEPSKSKGEQVNDNDLDLLRNNLSSFNYGVFELDDYYSSDYDYLEKYHQLTKALEETSEIKGPFKIEDFKPYERQIQDANTRLSKDFTRSKFTAKNYKKSKEKCIKLFNFLFSKFIGRDLEVAQIFFNRVNFYRLYGYFQIKLSIIQKLTLSQMIMILFNSLEVTVSEIIKVFDILQEEEQVIFMNFVLQYLTEGNQVQGCLEFLKWTIENNPKLFTRAFTLKKDGTTISPQAIQESSNYLKQSVYNLLSEKEYYCEDDLKDLTIFFQRLSLKEKIWKHIEQPLSIVKNNLYPFIKLLIDRSFIFAPLHLIKTMKIDVNKFLESNELYMPEHKALLLSTQGEGCMKEILESLTSERKTLPEWETLICELKYKNIILEEEEKSESDAIYLSNHKSIYQGFQPGNLVTDFVAKSYLTNLSDLIYTTALKSHRYLESRLSEQEILQRFGPDIKTELAGFALILGLPFTAYLYFKYDLGYSVLTDLDTECTPGEESYMYDISQQGHEEAKEDNIKLYEIIRAVYKLILKRPFDKQIISSMDGFLKLLNFDSDFFLTDVIAYRRIYISIYHEQNPNITAEEIVNLYTINESQIASTSSIDMKSVNSTYISLEKMELFLDIFCQNLSITLNLSKHASSGFGSTLIDALQMLEQATVSFETLTLATPQKDQTRKLDSPWRLVSKFCMLHNIPSSLKLLNEISVKNDWVRLLLELDVQKCPTETARDFINEYFHHAILKKHLLTSLEEIQQELEENEKEPQLLQYNEKIRKEILQEVEQNTENMPCGNNTEMIRVILQVRKVFQSVLEKVQLTEANKQELRETLANCLIEIGIEKKSELFCLFGAFLSEDKADTSCFNHLKIEITKLKPQLANSELEDVHVIVEWCKTNIERVIEILTIYYGDVSLKYLLEGLSEAKQNKFEDMHHCLTDFSSQISEEEHFESKFKICYIKFIKDTLDEVIKGQVLNETQLSKVLESLSFLNISKTYEDLYINYCAILSIKKKMLLNKKFKIFNTFEMIFDPFEIFYQMLENEMFAQAKSFGAHYDLEKSLSLFIQAKNIMIKQTNNQTKLTNHRELIDSILLLFIHNNALIYQSSYYIKYLSSFDSLTLWDQIYMLNISYKLLNSLPVGEEVSPPYLKAQKKKDKTRLRMQIITYSFFPDQIRKHLYQNKDPDMNELIYQLESNQPMKNINFSNSIETLLKNSYLNALSNFDYTFINDLNSQYQILLQKNDMYILFKYIQESIVETQFKNIYLKEVLDLFGFTEDTDLIRRLESKTKFIAHQDKAKDEQRDEVSQISRYQDPQFPAVMRLVQSYRALLETHPKEQIKTFFKAYLYFSRLASFSQERKHDDLGFKFHSIKEIHETMRRLSLKNLYNFLFVNDENRVEKVVIARFILFYLNLDLNSIVNDYFDYAYEELAVTEKKGFLERFIKLKKYEESNKKILAFSLVMNDEFKIKAAKICLNFLIANKVDPQRKCVMIGVAYYLLWELPETTKLYMKLLAIARDFFKNVLDERINGSTSEISDNLDPLCLLLIIFECNIILVKTVTDTLNKSERYDIWPLLLRNLEAEWGSILLQRSFKQGNLANIEPELHDMPLNLAFLLYSKAKKFLDTLSKSLLKITDSINVNKKIDKIIDHMRNNHAREDILLNLSLLAKQFLEAYRYFNFAKKDKYAHKALKFSYKIFSAIQSF